MHDDAPDTDAPVTDDGPEAEKLRRVLRETAISTGVTRAEAERVMFEHYIISDVMTS